MKKIISLSFIAVVLSVACYALGPLTPASGSYCMGSYLSIMDSTHPGGVWTSSNPSVATIGSSSGVVTSVAAGVVTMTYTLGGSYITGTYTINPAPTAIIGGGATICIGGTVTLSDAVSGGVWTSSVPGIASVGSATGVVTGVASGSTNIYYSIGSCSAITIVTVTSTGVAPITGPTSVCVGSPVGLYDATPGGTWSSSAPGIATIGSSGTLTGISAGVTTISYTATTSCGTYTVTQLDTVSTMPLPISGGGVAICTGSTVTLSDATPGGIWLTSSTTIAPVSSSGVVTGASPGVVNIFYETGACYVSTTVTVSATSAVAPISGSTYVCVGSTITLTDATPGGTWASSSPSIATISSSGVVTGVSAGSVILSYTATTLCGTYTVTKSDTVNAPTTPAPITGTTICMVGTGLGSWLSDATGGGSWSSSNTSIATVNTAGYVTGISAGSCTITYSLTTCGSAYVTTPFTVTPTDEINGHINFTSAPPDTADILKIWLIRLDISTGMLTAEDSLTLNPYSTSVPYQFFGAPADSYRVKAAVYHTPFTGTGYQPTYHTSSYYWYTANVFYHASGTVDASKDINMNYGSVAAGVGFIAGNISTGANKGTTGSSPAVGLLVYAVNSTGTSVQYTYTDASGNYNFSNLAMDNYTIFPEALSYKTTAYTSIALTTGSPSMSAASFTQHTISKTITPHTTGTPNIKPTVSSVIAFPNPTNGNLFVQWTVKAAEQGTVTISDVTGRVVMTNTIDLSAGTGSQQFDLSSLVNGTYVISVKSASLDYNNKIQVAH